MSGSPARVDPAAVKAEHEGHGRMNGKGACSWVRRGEEHCDAYLLAVEVERLAGRLETSWIEGDRLAARVLVLHQERDEARAEVERLAGKVESVRAEVSAWPLNAWMTQRVLSLLGVRDAALADQPEQVQPL